MEMRREVKLREVGKEPKKLQALQKALREKDESLTFFDLRIEQSRSLLAELQLVPSPFYLGLFCSTLRSC